MSDSTKQPCPILPKGIGHFQKRLKELISGGSATGFARKANLSEGVIRSYLRGDTYPTLDRLASLADAGNANPGWLATGEGPMRPGETTRPTTAAAAPGAQTPTTDHQLLRKCGIAIDNLYKEMGVHLSTVDLIQKVGEAHDDIISETSNPEEQTKNLNIIIKTIRREIQKELNANKTGKRSA